MKFTSQIHYNKSQRIGIIILITLLVFVEAGIWIINNNENPIQSTKVPQEIAALQQQINASQKTSYTQYPTSGKIEKFNPNSLNEEGWMNLGFSSKQVKTIFKYKNSLGGNFTSLDQIKSCFVISEEKFNEIKPFIILGSDDRIQKETSYTQHRASNKLKKFNPNTYSKEEWIGIGFSDKQAAIILKYKKSLGGKFSSLEQIKNCFVISEEKFNEIKPFMVLGSEDKIIQEEITSDTQHQASGKLEKFNPNNLTKEQWKELGFSDRQINTIFNYKKSLGGKFKDAETLKKCYSISEEKFAEIEPYLFFE